MKMKFNERNVCFSVAVALLGLTLLFTACGASTAEATFDNKPCYHVTVYSPEIEKVGYAGRRKPKYTVTVDSFSELVPSSYSYEKAYQLLQIPLEDGRFELVSTSLVEIEYY
nr:MAG TPA: lipoprotein [Caudoviricetes sp.]